MSIMVVIPAFNEEARIGATLEAVKSLPGISRILVVSDGSTDRTPDVARQLGVEVLELAANQGKGGAMNASLPLIDTDIVVFLDADLGQSAREAGKLIDPLIKGTADLSIAAFPPPTRKGGFGIVKGTAAWALRRQGQMQAASPLSGQRAMHRQVLQVVAPFQERYGVELGMTLTALRKGFRVVEVPTLMSHNESGRNLTGFIHRGRQFLDILRLLFLVRR
ncbi:MAG TPA: glycosyltransferase family 2 protein [Syntrophomonadaceae bacterium]|nr:glycosyltransferase family 2 protein [Syntrophomonadaceae bacterium]